MIFTGVRAAFAIPHSYLRIRAQWPRHIGLAVADTCCLYPVWCNAAFTPIVDGVEKISLVGADTTTAMTHAGHHEHAQPVRLITTQSVLY